MSNFAKNIGEKRTPVTTPAHIVENGVAHYGTFSEPFQDLNLLDCKKPFFMKTPSFIKRMRLIEWEAFEVNMDEGSLISACYNMGPIGFPFRMAQQRRQQNLCLAQSRARETREGRKTTFVRQLLLQNQKERI